MSTPFDAWVGREEHFEERILSSKVLAMAATLDLQEFPGPCDPLPAGWHWMFFNPVVARRGLGSDGHPQRGGFLPPIEPARRMWAGSRIRYLAPLPVDVMAQRVSRIQSVLHKQGRQGSLWFVTVNHRTLSQGTVCIEEEQDIVYREPSAQTANSGPAPEPAKAAVGWQQDVVPDSTMLFRYSALTFNGHRIHYDQDYARHVEGYPDLVVHGPLTATLLQQFASIKSGRALSAFEFRGVSPLFVGRPVRLKGCQTDANQLLVWACGPQGELAMTAKAQLG